jgi:hypothetical protein
MGCCPLVCLGHGVLPPRLPRPCLPSRLHSVLCPARLAAEPRLFWRRPAETHTSGRDRAGAHGLWPWLRMAGAMVAHGCGHGCAWLGPWLRMAGAMVAHGCGHGCAWLGPWLRMAVAMVAHGCGHGCAWLGPWLHMAVAMVAHGWGHAGGLDGARPWGAGIDWPPFDRAWPGLGYAHGFLRGRTPLLWYAIFGFLRGRSA